MVVCVCACVCVWVCDLTCSRYPYSPANFVLAHQSCYTSPDMVKTETHISNDISSFVFMCLLLSPLLQFLSQSRVLYFTKFFCVWQPPPTHTHTHKSRKKAKETTNWPQSVMKAALVMVWIPNWLFTSSLYALPLPFIRHNFTKTWLCASLGSIIRYFNK